MANERTDYPHPLSIAGALIAWFGVEMAGVGVFDAFLVGSHTGHRMVQIGAGLFVLGALILISKRLHGKIGGKRLCVLAFGLTPLTLFPLFIGWRIALAAEQHTRCDRGEAIACRIAAEGRAKRGKTDEAIALFTKGCDLDNARACRELAGQAKRHPGSIAQTPLYFYKKACKLQDGIACNRVGLALRESAPHKAQAFFERACDLHDYSACSVLEEISPSDEENTPYPTAP